MSKRKPRVKQISCQEAIGRVFDFIDAELQERSREELEQHLQACRHCFDRVEFERLVKSRLAKLKVNPSSPGLPKRVSDLIEQF